MVLKFGIGAQKFGIACLLFENFPTVFFVDIAGGSEMLNHIPDQ